MTGSVHYYCTAGRGTEAFLEQELKDTFQDSVDQITVTDGKVFFKLSGDVDGVKKVLELKTAERAFVQVLLMKTKDLDQKNLIYSIKRHLNDKTAWDEALSVLLRARKASGRGDNFAEEIKQGYSSDHRKDEDEPPLKRSKLDISKNSENITFRVNFKIPSYFRKRLSLKFVHQQIGMHIKHLTDWKIDLRHPFLEICCQLNMEHFTVGLPLTREPLSKRNFIKLIGLRSTIAHIMIQLVQIQPGDRVLDPLCGTATILIEAAHHMTAEYIGIDQSESQLQRARENVKFAKTDNIQLIHGDAIYLPLQDGSIDKIVTDAPFGNTHTTDLPLEEFYNTVLQEFSRILTPSGKLVMLTSSAMKSFLTKFLSTQFPGANEEDPTKDNFGEENPEHCCCDSEKVLVEPVENNKHANQEKDEKKSVKVDSGVKSNKVLVETVEDSEHANQEENEMKVSVRVDSVKVGSDINSKIHSDETSESVTLTVQSGHSKTDVSDGGEDKVSVKVDSVKVDSDINSKIHSDETSESVTLTVQSGHSKTDVSDGGEDKVSVKVDSVKVDSDINSKIHSDETSESVTLTVQSGHSKTDVSDGGEDKVSVKVDSVKVDSGINSKIHSDETSESVTLTVQSGHSKTDVSDGGEDKVSVKVDSVKVGSDINSKIHSDETSESVTLTVQSGHSKTDVSDGGEDKVSVKVDSVKVDSDINSKIHSDETSESVTLTVQSGHSKTDVSDGGEDKVSVKVDSVKVDSDINSKIHSDETSESVTLTVQSGHSKTDVSDGGEDKVSVKVDSVKVDSGINSKIHSDETTESVILPVQSGHGKTDVNDDCEGKSLSVLSRITSSIDLVLLDSHYVKLGETDAYICVFEKDAEAVIT